VREKKAWWFTQGSVTGGSAVEKEREWRKERKKKNSFQGRFKPVCSSGGLAWPGPRGKRGGGWWTGYDRRRAPNSREFHDKRLVTSTFVFIDLIGLMYWNFF